jgi:2-polyprenyl-3-methyl-5-hydroxy-6-metoxy-1,4-benzoquinol methylase
VASPGEVLVVGCGLLHEIDDAPAGLSYFVVDFVDRAVEAVRQRNDARISGGCVVPPERPIDQVLHSVLGTKHRFSAIYAKEVVEHVLAWPEWLVGLRKLLAPGASLWLSTPNYGEPWLPTLESTVLDGRAPDGFSRRHIHPTRFSGARSRAG